MTINERFREVIPSIYTIEPVIPSVVAQSTTQTSQAGAATSTVTGSTITIPAGEFPPGATFRFTLGGSKTGANAAMVVHISLGGTQVISLTADDASAVDWMAQFIISSMSLTTQGCMGWFNALTADPVVDVASGTVDMTNGGVIKAQIQSQNASDTVVCNYVLVEFWVK